MSQHTRWPALSIGARAHNSRAHAYGGPRFMFPLSSEQLQLAQLANDDIRSKVLIANNPST
jgi:hypothetical protein